MPSPPVFMRNCPNCDAMYQVLKAEAGPETDSRQIACRVCGGPLVSREGKTVLKYFLLRSATRPRVNRARRLNAPKARATES